MTVSDLMRWFDRPRATVNTWVGGRQPFGPQSRTALKRLEMLEFSIANRAEYYPVPDDMSWAKRREYVQGMLDDARRNHRISEMRVAG